MMSLVSIVLAACWPIEAQLSALPIDGQWCRPYSSVVSAHVVPALLCLVEVVLRPLMSVLILNLLKKLNKFSF